ncbi:hypothetical protein [Micromonospora sp. NPDC005161]
MHDEPRRQSALGSWPVNRNRDVNLRSPAKTRDAVQLQCGVEDSEGTWAKACHRCPNPRPVQCRVTQLGGRHETAPDEALPPAGSAKLSDLIPGQAGA